ncbi:hypothetical protein [Chryseobacterium sp.]|uniref:hypothetical protein n=1 Tax=Chryseobacterium sp. TaxID=1871047 RepID=UPI0028A13E49|nr:hypothetical protein [Chryseobacterium sp.]
MRKLNNPILNTLNATFNNVTKNAVFYSTAIIPQDHRSRIFNDDVKKTFNIPEQVNNWYEYTIYLGSDYSRLRMLTIISACSDIEFLLKTFIEKYFDTSISKSKNYYQKLDLVNKEIFIPNGIDLDSYEFFKKIKIAFQLRHICIHNMGFIDETFIKNTGLSLTLDQQFEISDAFINEIFDAIEELFGLLDTL